MTVEVTVRGSGIPNNMRKYAEEKGEKLRRFFNGIHKLEVVLGEDGMSKRAEVVLHILGTDPIVTHAEHEQMNAAIDLVMGKSEKRLIKHKEKLRDHHRVDASTGPMPAEDESDGEEELESYNEIVAKRDFDQKD